jgi:hypothetical protein
MGHITSSLEAENDLTVVTVAGKVDVEQVLGQIISFLSGERDLREGSLAGLSSADLQLLVERGHHAGRFAPTLTSIPLFARAWGGSSL